MGQNHPNLMKKHCKKAETKESGASSSSSSNNTRPFGSSLGAPYREETLKSSLFIKLRTRVGSVTAHYDHRSTAGSTGVNYRQLPLPTTEAARLVDTPRGVAKVTPFKTFNFSELGYEVPRNIHVNQNPIEREDENIYESVG